MPAPDIIRPCPISTPCIDPAVPITNYSSEAPDPITFFSTNYPWIDPNDPVGGGPCDNCPPPVWFGPGCNSVCVSQVSQQDADLCAARQAFICAHAGETIFLNNRQQCEAFCPDGLPFVYVVPAGQFPGTSQAAADSQAGAFACDALRAFMFCFGDITKEACINSAYSSTITPSRGTGPFSYVVFGGSLPNGLSAHQVGSSLVISGTPTVAGSFSFIVKATDTFGNFMQKVYTICVVDITPGTLPDATIGTAYSQQLSATACAATPQSWQVVGGSLPPGLSLDESTGIISGTPTGPAAGYLFTVLFQDSST